jgi:guanylate kinase
MKNEKIILVGKSGSGKDFLLRGLVKMGLKYQPKITTRPIRKSEKQGVEYIFESNEIFENLLKSNQIKTHQHFLINDCDWFYAITNENFDNHQLFIMTPHEISCLTEEARKQCFVVYLDICEEVRRKRINRRNDNNDSVNRRIEADNQDFLGFSDYDLRITDPDFEVSMVYDLMY